MAELYNEQRVLGVRFVDDSTKMFNDQRVLGVVPQTRATKSTNLVALYGDSLVAQTFMDPGTRVRRTVYNSINIANALSGQRMQFVVKRAASGERSDQILQRFLADLGNGSLVASGAGTLIFTMGTNDIAQSSYTDLLSGAAVTLTNVADNIVANAARLLNACSALGIQCIFRTLHGASNYNAAMIAATADANRKIQALCKGRRDVHLLEVRDALRNPLTTTSSAITFRTGAMMNDSGVFVHEAVPGAYAVGKKLAEIIKEAIPPLPVSYSDASERYSANYPTQLLTNPEFSGTSGTLNAGGTLGTNATGGALAGVPTSWIARRRANDTTTAFTVNVGEDAAGRYVEFVITATAANGGILFQNEVTSPATKVAAGEVLQGFSTVEVMSGATNLGAASPSMDFNYTRDGVNASIYAHGCNQPGTGVGNYGVFPSTEGFTFEDATEPATLPAFDSVQWIVSRALDIIFMAPGSATIRVRRPRLEKLAAV